MNIVDKRNTLVRHVSRRYGRRQKSEIKHIAIHHSATTSGSAEAFARYHVNHLNWPGIGYHYVVDKDGTISLCHDLEVVSFHVGNSNRRAVGICMVGDFRSQALEPNQKRATMDLVFKLMEDLNLSIEDVWGHIEFPGYSWKPCPSIDMDTFRRDLQNDNDRTIDVTVVSGSSNRFIRQGDTGVAVEALQQQLDELGFDPGPIDGIFGPLTLDAVQRFQRVANLTVDGIVGPKTKEALNSFSQSDLTEIEHASPTDEDDGNQPSTSVQRRMLRFVRPMMRGEDVREVQSKVAADVDGIYGPDTENKVKQFQRRNHLTVDGIVGPVTWGVLDRVTSSETTNSTNNRLLFLQRPFMQGDDVKTVQSIVNATVDGIFGPETERLVRQFQQRNNLVVDGIVGPATWNALSISNGAQNINRRLLTLRTPFMTGDDVRQVQRALNVTVDGIYGPLTERAVRNFQRNNNLVVDGIVGPQTWNRLIQ